MDANKNFFKNSTDAMIKTSYNALIRVKNKKEEKIN